jgi:hypothetical protein
LVELGAEIQIEVTHREAGGEGVVAAATRRIANAMRRVKRSMMVLVYILLRCVLKSRSQLKRLR